MSTRYPEQATELGTFGRRKIRPLVCIIDGKQHIRTFLGEILEELDFITCECAEVAELDSVLAVQARTPDLVVLGLSAGGIEGSAVLKALAARVFNGKALLLGPRNSPVATAVQELGLELGIAMLPMLGSPFASESLRDSVAALRPAGAPPSPPVDVAEALSAGRLELWYQPRFNAHTLLLCGAEALIRLRHPTWGIVPPAYFIPDKRDPHMRVLSEFVVGRAIDDWRYFLAQERGIEIAVNLPLTYFQDPDSVARLCDSMPDHPAFDGLIIKLDAMEVFGNLDLARALARRLRFGNIGLAIDDIGSEWPSLVGLDDFPFVEIKVEREFVASCVEDRLKQSTCRKILDLADRFGARTVAGGVETRAGYQAVREMGFDLVEGSLFAKPMTAQKFARTMLRRPVSIPR